MSTSEGDCDVNNDTKGLEEREKVNKYTKWIWSLIEESVGNEVVEVGCGRAPLVPYFTSVCQRYHGVDQSGTILREIRQEYQANSRADFTQLDLETTAIIDYLSSLSFDTIVSLNLLEHLENDERLLRIFSDQLDETDRLILQVPAHPWLFGTNDQSLGHYRRYSLENLRTKLEKTGHELLQSRYFNVLGILPWFLEGKIFRRTKGHFEDQSEGALSLQNAIVPVLQQLEDLVSPPVGISLFCVTRPRSA